MACGFCEAEGVVRFCYVTVLSANAVSVARENVKAEECSKGYLPYLLTHPLPSWKPHKVLGLLRSSLLHACRHFPISVFPHLKFITHALRFWAKVV